MPALGSLALSIMDQAYCVDGTITVMLQLTAGINSADGFSFFCPRPAALNQPRVVIERVSGRALNQATPHPTVAGDGITAQLRNADSSNGRSGFHTVPWFQTGTSSGTTRGAQAFTMDWPWGNRIWTTGEVIFIQAGPIDDDAAPTGDLNLVITCRVYP